MPNHLHAILVFASPTTKSLNTSQHKIAPASLGAVLAQFKSRVTKRIIEERGGEKVQVWQRNYHERIIRNEAELNVTRRYIIENPLRWGRADD